MKSYILILSLSTSLCAAQTIDEAYTGAVSLSKFASLPVITYDSTWADTVFQTGTGVMLGDAFHRLVLTCEHVVVIKDSLDKTVREASKVVFALNLTDSTAAFVPTRVLYRDEALDFALLEVDNAVTSPPFYVKMITVSQCKSTREFEEGRPVLYVGYPMSFGIGKANHPLSRTAIVSQLIPGATHFLIDGFVQHGHSGSPVFAIYCRNDTLSRYLIGITRGYPKQYTSVLEPVTMREGKNQVVLNPGFTVVTPMDAVLQVLRSKFQFR